MANSISEDSPWYINRQRKVCFDEDDYRAFLAQLHRKLVDRQEFAVVVASDAALRRANKQFRHQSSTTDVLSFPDGEDGRLGDILISAGRAKRQASNFGHSVEQELKILVLHGLLHLMGYDHETNGNRMEQIEEYWRKKLRLPSGLIKRTKS